MPDFDYQWKNLPSKYIEYNKERIKEFLNFTGLKPSSFISKKYPTIFGKVCLDIGCGNGRYTYAMQQLGAARVDSFDMSPEAIAKCRQINPNAQVKNIMDLEPNPTYDFVLCWGVINHVENPREAFHKVALQVKPGGMLHVMVYHKDTQKNYEEGRKLWATMTHDERIGYCKKMIGKHEGELHGWWDALNPTYNWSWHEDEIRKWFEDEGFDHQKLTKKYNINMNGVRR